MVFLKPQQLQNAWQLHIDLIAWVFTSDLQVEEMAGSAEVQCCNDEHKHACRLSLWGQLRLLQALRSIGQTTHLCTCVHLTPLRHPSSTKLCTEAVIGLLSLTMTSASLCQGPPMLMRVPCREMLATKGPYLLDVMVPHVEHVLPMIPGGASFKEVITDGDGTREY